MPLWKEIGSGTYNRVYVNEEKECVLKLPKTIATYDRPLRAVRIWNQVNDSITPAARIMVATTGDVSKEGWTCPYIQGTNPSDQELSIAIIDIYNKTGRIVVDGPSRGNFLKTAEGKVVCVDVGMALELDQRDEYTPPGGGRRRKSITSQLAWSELEGNYSEYFKECATYTPRTVNTIKALLYLKKNRPDLHDVSFLKNQKAIINRLAWAYDAREELDSAPDCTLTEAQKQTNRTIRTNASKRLELCLEQQAEPAIHPPAAQKAPTVTIAISSHLRYRRKRCAEASSSKADASVQLQHAIDYCVNELRPYAPSSAGDESQSSIGSWLFSFFTPSINAEQGNRLIASIQEATSISQISQIIETAIETYSGNMCFGNAIEHSLHACLARLNSAVEEAQIVRMNSRITAPIDVN